MNKFVAIMKRNSIITALVILEIAIFIITMMQYGKEKVQLTIPYQDIIGTTIPDDRDGWYVDETFPLEESGIFDHSDDITLKKGTYDITVQYETDTDLNYSTVSADTKGYHTLWTDKTPLTHKLNEITYTVYLFENVDNFHIETYFGGQGYMIIKGFKVTETRAFLRMVLFLEFFIAVLLNVIYFLCQKKYLAKISNRAIYEMIAILGIGLLSSIPLLGGYMVMTQDIGFHLLRIEGIKEGILSGQFPVKMQPNWMYGYGYPTSIYYGDLFLYLPAFLRLVGLPVQTAYHVFTFAINVATAGIAFWSFRRICKDRNIGMLAALLYTLAPYRLCDLYAREAVGEFTAITFLPLLAYGMYAVFTENEKDKKYQKLWIPMLIGFTGIIQSHVLTCMMCALFIIIICILQIRKVFRKNTFIVLAKTVIYTTLLNIWFLIPCMLTMSPLDIVQLYRTKGRIQSEGIQILQMFNVFYQGCGDGHSAYEGVAGEVPEGVGLALGIGLIIMIVAWISSRGKTEKVPQAGKYFFGLGILSLYCASVLFPWDYLCTLLGTHDMTIVNIQFAMRFLGLTNVFLAVTSGIGLKYWKSNMQKEYYFIAFTLCMIFGLMIASYIEDSVIYHSEAHHVYDIDALGRTDHNVKEYLIYPTDIEALVPNEITQSNNISFDGYQKHFTTIHVTCENASEAEGYIQLPLLYYPEYVAKDTNGNKLEVIPGDNNILRVVLQPGYQGNIKISFEEPLLWRICELISALFLMCMLFYFTYHKRKVWNED